MKKNFLANIHRSAIGTFLLLAISTGATAQNTSYDANTVPVNGNENVAIGIGALITNTTGQRITANGFRALFNNTTGSNNSAIGSETLFNNTTGGNNTASGYRALFANTTGSANTAFGMGALSSNTIGTSNVAIGGFALVANTSGQANTVLGSLAATGNTTGNNNTAIGAYSVVGVTNSNATALGAYANVGAVNDKVRVGSATVTVIEGQVNFSIPSDGRFKENVSDKDVQGLAFIRKLRPVVYNFNTEKYAAFLTQDMPDSLRKIYMAQHFDASKARRQHGFIAQEVEQAAESLGYDFDGLRKPQNSHDNYSVAYSTFVIPLVKAVQEQQVMIEDQAVTSKKMQAEIDELKKLNENLMAIVKQQQQQVTALLGSTTTEKASTIVTNAELGNNGALGQNVPNPFNEQTSIVYNIPLKVSNAQLLFYTLDGKLVKTVNVVTRGKGVLKVQTNDLALGTYTYSLVIDGKVVDVKKMVKQ